jgi:DNA-binding beta-propeller fold protein YncE
LIAADYGNRRVIRYFNDQHLNKQIILDNIDCYGLTMDNYGYLYVSDWKKNQIKRWKKGENNNGIIVAGGNGKGHSLNQLNRPTFICVDDEQSIYISDSDNHRVIKWKKDAREGIIVAGGNGPGHGLHQISSPQGIVLDSYGQIYVVDYDNNRVMQWYEGINEGLIIIGEDDQGKQLLDEPRGLALDLHGNIYVGDIGNDRILKFERFTN